MVVVTLKGGEGSGHHGHAGIPGKHGGSLPGGGIPKKVATETENRTRRAKAWRRDAINGKINPGRAGKAPPAKGWYDYTPDAGAEDVLNNTIDLGYDSHWNSADFDTRGTVKNTIVTQLSGDTGLPYNAVNESIAEWAHTSNDNDWQPLSMQQAASEEFGVELSDWQKGSIKAYGPGGVLFSNTTPALDNSQQRRLLRTMYANTQANFAKQGFKGTDTVTLYRGFKSGDITTNMAGNVVNWKGNALESWSVSRSVANNFGHNVIAMEVPIRNVIGTCVTGFGCLTEGEYVITGSQNSKARLIKADMATIGG